MQKGFSPDSKGKYLGIRHGETLYNRECALVKDKFPGTTDPNFIDSRGSETGIEQIKSNRVGFEDINMHEIFVSPLERALESAFILFENHPKREDIIIKINPLITESIGSVHDFPCKINEKKTKYNMTTKVKFDWSDFDSVYKTDLDWELFFFDFIDTLTAEELQNMKDKLKNAYSNKDSNDIRLQLTQGGVLKNKKHLKKLESFKHGFNRCCDFKEYLNKKYGTNNQEEKVLVICHSQFMAMLTSEGAFKGDTIDELPKDVYKPKNGEIVSMYLN